MKFTEHDVDQLSDEWFQLKAGKLSSSRAYDMLDFLKSGTESAKRRNLRTKLAVERVTGRYCDDSGFISAPMQRGLDMEPEAAAAYEAHTGELVTLVGLVTADGLDVSASPDGVVGDYEGIVEIKCPLGGTHWETWKDGKIPPRYMPQLRHLLWTTGAEWIDYAQWHGDFPDALELFLVRLERDEAGLAEYEERALEFLGEVDAEVELVESKRYGKAHAA